MPGRIGRQHFRLLNSRPAPEREANRTLAPYLVSGPAKRIVAGPALVPPPALRLHTACEEDGYLFLRYRLPAR